MELEDNQEYYPDFGVVYLNYDFGIKDYQIVFFDHIYGSTLAIAAKLKILKTNKNGIKRIRAKFKSTVVGGRLNFALRSVDPVIIDNGEIDGVREHQFVVNINPFTKYDIDFDPLDLEFETEFELGTDTFLINLTPNNIIDLPSGSINIKKEDADGGWDCKSKVVNSGG